MKECLRLLHGRKNTVAAIILLLFIQAACELMLPKCTADIIDIGIGQSGIPSVLCEQFSEGGMNRILLLLTTEEEAVVRAGYIQKEERYVLQELSKEEKEELVSVITAPMVAVYALTTEGADYEEILGDEMYIPRGIDAFGLLAMMPYETRIELSMLAREKIEEIPQSLVIQAAYNFVRSDLTVQGIDVNEIQVNYLLTRGAGMLLSVFGMIVSAVLAIYLTSKLSAGIESDLRQKIFGHVMDLEPQEMERLSVVSLRVSVTEEPERAGEFVSAILRTLIYGLMLGGGTVVVSLQIHAGFGIILSGCLCAAVLVIVLSALVITARHDKICVRKQEFAHLVREMLRGIQTIRVFGAGRREYERLRRKCTDAGREAMRMNRSISLLIPLIMLIASAGGILLVWNGVNEINAGGLQAGEMMACILYSVLILDVLISLASLVPALPGAAAAAKSLEKLLNDPIIGMKCRSAGSRQSVDMESACGRQCAAAESAGDKQNMAITFQNVIFKYPDRNVPVLERVSFAVPYDSMTAVIGGTGSGKTTLLQLIAGLQKPTEGRITVDGKEISEYTKEELRQRIGYVMQEPVLFTGTVAYNLRAGGYEVGEEIPEERLEKALKAAQAEEFLKEKGLETQVASGGADFTGGQRHRLCIARALSRDLEVYLLDDSCAALDGTTARKLRTALSAVAENGAAVIYTTQQVRDASDADQILVLERGRVAAYGTHEQLMAECREYRQTAQEQGYE